MADYIVMVERNVVQYMTAYVLYTQPGFVSKLVFCPYWIKDTIQEVSSGNRLEFF